MDLVWELVRALGFLIYLKNVCHLRLRRGAPLPNPVLQFKFCYCKFEDDILANLTIDRDPSYPRLFHDFALVEGFEAKAPLIRIGYYEFPLNPIIDLLICLANNWVEGCRFALLKLDHKRAGL